MEAPERICDVAGCGMQHHARGLCKEHYRRFSRYGSPHILRKRRHSEAIDFIKDLPKDHDACILWPFAVDHAGYGRISVNRKQHKASRMVAIIHHGQPTGNMEAAHSCGNSLCVNPTHIRWATKSENEADKVFHGTSPRGERHGAAKITENQARFIKQNKGKISPRQLSEMIGVKIGIIYSINNGEKWKWLE